MSSLLHQRIDAILRDAHERNLFSGVAWSVGTSTGEVASGITGTLRQNGEGAPIDADTWWDLASLTKPVVGLLVMSLIETGELTLDDSVGTFLPEFRDSDKADATVRDLLTHTSGMPGQVPMYRWSRCAQDLYASIRDIPMACPPNQRVIYSSSGFILLGMIAEASADVDLATLVRERVTDPTGMTHTGFALTEAETVRAAATENCPWRGGIVQGTVHDENAVILGAPAGHAGLFAPLTDVRALALMLARGGKGEYGRVLSVASHAEMVRPRTDHLNLRRSLAFQGKDLAESPAGDLCGPLTYGHTGFTGTSLFVDPEVDVYVVLLSNRVHPSRTTEGFARVRRQVHNVAFATLTA